MALIAVHRYAVTHKHIRRPVLYNRGRESKTVKIKAITSDDILTVQYVGLIQLTSNQAHLTMLAISRLHASGKIIGSGKGKSRGCEDKTLLLSDASSYCR